jgi:hypothetical protein
LGNYKGKRIGFASADFWLFITHKSYRAGAQGK